DRLGGAGDAELRRDRRRGAAHDLDTVVGEGVEAFERGLDRVDADWQIEKVGLALRVGDLRLVERTGQLDAGAWQASAGRALYRHVAPPSDHVRGRNR